jgi:hypothetical protein
LKCENATPPEAIRIGNHGQTSQPKPVKKEEAGGNNAFYLLETEANSSMLTWAKN